MTADLFFIKSNGGHFVSPTACVDKYEGTGHEIIIRELTQNALDAAREAEPKRPCKLVFEIRNVLTEKLPGVEVCQEHLGYMHHWEQESRQNYNDVLRNLRQLYSSTEVTCLFVQDNGVGLDSYRMEKLFGEGDSGKSETDGASGGTHGVGHKTAFAAGDMNYVLYGGVSRDAFGKVHKSASGHVRFPSHKWQDELFTRWSGHAYLARNINFPDNNSGIEIINDEREIPPLLREELDRIEQENDTGSVVIIPAFNFFFNDGNAADLICENIAKHFFAAIDQGRLSVHVYDDTATSNDSPKEHTMNCRKDVDEILSRQHILQNKYKKDATQLVAGRNIAEAWKTWKEALDPSLPSSAIHSLSTPFGEIRAYIRYTDTGPRRICIVRAGMFITDDDTDMPGSLKRSQFSSRKPFHAVLHFADSLQASDVKADQILRDAENEGHTSILRNKRDGIGKDWPALCKEIRIALLEVLEENPRNDSFTPDDFSIVVGGVGGWQQPMPVLPRPIIPDDNGVEPDPEPLPVPPIPPPPIPPPPIPPNPKPRKVGRPLEIADTVMPAGPDQVEVEIVGPDRTLPNALVQLQIRTGSDDTCEQPLRGRSIELDLARSLLDGEPLGKGTGTEIPLGRVEAGSRFRLSLQLAQGQDAELPMRAVMYRRRRKS